MPKIDPARHRVSAWGCRSARQRAPRLRCRHKSFNVPAEPEQGQATLRSVKLFAAQVMPELAATRQYGVW